MANNTGEFVKGAAIGVVAWLAVDVVFTKLLDTITSNQGRMYRGF